MTRGVKSSQAVKKRTRVKRKTKEGLEYRRNEERLAVRTEAKALVKEELTLRDEGLRSKED